jgi:hypothetical protein
MAVKLTAALVEAFAGTFLSPMYDDPQPTPQCHRDWWELYCGEDPFVALAAPRGHAKSTALTHDFILANVCFRVEPHVLIVSATEELAMAHLSDIAKELRDNDELRRAFSINKFLVDSKGEIIVHCNPDADYPKGFDFRIIARGAGQKLRGIKWRGRRPGLIIADDMEEDEQVENFDRRRKFRRWVMRALLPLGRRECKIRWHGTILHEDSMLQRLMKDKTCKSALYRAHRAFDDFRDILWPEMWNEARLRGFRQAYIEQGDPAGYSQELLNDPYAQDSVYLRKEGFLPMVEADWMRPKRKCVGCDFAVSTTAKANRTSFTVGGQDAGNLLHIIDQTDGRWDALEWIDEMFRIQELHDPEAFFVEDGVIWKSVRSTVYREMTARGKWMNIVPLASTKDKAVRGKALQKRHRAGSMRFYKDADWYEVYEAELLRFTGTSDALEDDRFDSTAILVRGFESMSELEDEDFMEEEELDLIYGGPQQNAGRSLVTGY